MPPLKTNSGLNSSTRRWSKGTGTSKPPASGFVQRMVLGLLAVVFLCVWIMTSESDGSSASTRDTSKTQVEKAVPSVAVSQEESAVPPSETQPKEPKEVAVTQVCPGFCQARHEQLKKHHNGFDLANLGDMLTIAQKEQDALLEMLKADYGQEVYDKIWAKKAHSALLSANQTREYSTRHFKRKIQMKLLRVQMKILSERQNLEGCNCLEEQNLQQSMRRRRQLQEQQIVLPEVPEFYDRFVWSTGGHSAAAGHGNLHNESYTAYLQRAIKPMFNALGVDFEARNYAMGGMDSTPHIALCQEAIFGLDADIISWDFGMTDGRAFWKTTFYANRVGMHANRPTHVSLGIDGRQFGQRRDAILQAEDLGVPAMFFNPSVWEDALKSIPDMFGMTQEQMDSYPPFSKNFKCKDQLEKEEPCGQFKYNDNFCPNRKFKASWHPGWRIMALTGNLIGVRMSEIIIEVIKGWQKDNQNPFELYERLQKEEDTDYERLYATKLPDMMGGMVPENLVSEGIKANDLYRNKAICHTGLLPAESRYLGILTQSEKKGRHSYDMGVPFEDAMRESSGSELPLVYEPKQRQECEVELSIDFKDYWVVKGNEDWKSITVPNDAEMAAYAKDGFQPSGIVMICLMKCDWGRCPDGEVQKEGFVDGYLKFEVNGDRIVNMTGFEEWAQCAALRGETNGHYHKPNSDGKFEVKAKVEGSDKSFARIMSVITL